MTLSELEQLILTVPCAYCHVEAGAWCVSRRRRLRSSHLHSARAQAIYDAWRIGYREAHEDILKMLERGDTRNEVVTYVRRLLA